MRTIMLVIWVAVAITVAVGQVPGLNTTLGTITTPTYSGGTASIWGIMLLIFGVFVLGTIAKEMDLV